MGRGYRIRSGLSRVLRVTLVIAAFLIPPHLQIALANDTNLAERIGTSEYTIQDLDLSAPSKSRAGTKQFSVLLDGDLVTVELTPQSVRTEDFNLLEIDAAGLQRAIPPPPPSTYQGVIAEQPSSKVLASFETSGSLRANITDESGDTWRILPLGDFQTAKAGAHVVVWGPLLGEEESVSCGVDSPAISLITTGTSGSSTKRAPAGTTTPSKRVIIDTNDLTIAKIAFDVENEVLLIHGNSISSVMQSIESNLLKANQIFEEKLGITHKLSAVVIRTTEPDPYESAPTYSQLLGKLKTTWQLFHGEIDRDVVALLSNWNYGYGGAASGNICPENPSGYIYIHTIGTTLSDRTLAHELGHVWGSSHVNDDPTGGLMCGGGGGCAGDQMIMGDVSAQLVRDWIGMMDSSCDLFADVNDYIDLSTTSLTANISIPSGTSVVQSFEAKALNEPDPVHASYTITLPPGLTISNPVVQYPNGTNVLSCSQTGQQVVCNLGPFAHLSSNVIQFTSYPVLQTNDAFRLYSVSPNHDQLYVLNPTNGALVSSVPVTLSGSTVTGIHGLAMHPVSKEFFALLGLSNQAAPQLVTINADTGVSASKGNLGTNLTSLTFTPAGTLFALSSLMPAGTNISLFSLNLSNGFRTLKYTFPGGSQSTLAWHPVDDRLFHLGIYGTQVMLSALYPETNALRTVPIKGTIHGIPSAMTWLSGYEFLVADTSQKFYRVNIDGYVREVGSYGHSYSRGMIPDHPMLLETVGRITYTNNPGSSITDYNPLNNVAFQLITVTQSNVTPLIDTDSDGVPNFFDNCPTNANADQLDSDRDGIGDVCDNCLLLSNPDQADPDADGLGSACDNCPTQSNMDQADSDADLSGDACDNCPATANYDQQDDDNDNVGNDCDNCPFVSNPLQEDANTNGFGDVCDLSEVAGCTNFTLVTNQVLTINGGSIALGDLDNDGDLDAFISSSNSMVLLNDGSGFFVTNQLLGGLASEISDVELGYLDTDNYLDAFVLHNGSPAYVFLNNGNGSFRTNQQIALIPFSNYYLALADINGDGKIDAFLGSNTFINSGSGTFSPDQTITNRLTSQPLMRDLDGDGDQDLNVFSINSYTASVTHINNGSGQFTNAISTSWNFNPSHKRLLADFDLDGDIDFYGASSDGDKLWLNDGDATFTLAQEWSLFEYTVYAAAVCDLDADGYPDVLLSQKRTVLDEPNNLAIRLNKGAANFPILTNLSVSGTMSPSNVRSADRLATGDLNGDGTIDVIAVNPWSATSNNYTIVYLNTAACVDPAVVQSASPAPTVVGTSILYTVIVSNNHGKPVSGISVFDVLPPTVQFDAAGSSSGWSNNAGTLSLSVPGTLAPWAWTSYVVQVHINPATPSYLTNTVTLTSAGEDQNLPNNTASVVLFLDNDLDSTGNYTDPDDDNDGMSDETESLSGSDQFDASEYLGVTSILNVSPTGNLWILQWMSETNKTYRLLRTTDLIGGFNVLMATNIPGTPPTNTSFTAVPIYTPFMLYRVELEGVGDDF